MDYTGFVYLWYDKKKKLFCVGSHMGDVNDGYITSTGIMKKAYKRRSSDFVRRILHFHDGDYASLLEMEQYFLDMIDEEELFYGSRRRYYNVKKNASGLSGPVASDIRKRFLATPEGQVWLEGQRARMEGNKYMEGKEPWNRGKVCPSISEGKMKNPTKYTEEYIENKSKKMKEMWEAGVFDNRPLPTPEQIEKRRQAQLDQNRKQTDHQKQRAKEANSLDWIVTFPDGHEEEITNLTEFCKQYGLDQGNMSKVARGSLKTHKKFKCRFKT